MNLDGVQLPCRAIVRSSAADGDGYRATVETLDGAGDPTGQKLPDLPLDPFWDGRDGAGLFIPPKPGRIVGVAWMGGSAGHPVIVGPAWPRMTPAVPSIPVAVGEGSLQDGRGGEFRYMGDGTWRWRDDAGAEISVNPAHLWRIASAAETLHAVLAAMIVAGKEATTVLDTDTPSGSAGRQLGMNPATKAAWDAAQALLDATLYP